MSHCQHTFHGLCDECKKPIQTNISGTQDLKDRKIKDIIEEILQDFQSENHILFRDQDQARRLILRAYIRGKKDESEIIYAHS